MTLTDCSLKEAFFAGLQMTSTDDPYPRKPKTTRYHGVSHVLLPAEIAYLRYSSMICRSESEIVIT